MERSIYILDDHTLFRQGLESLLVAGGYCVAGGGANPTLALDVLRRLEPAVILIDIHLCGRSGLDMLREMRARNLKTRALVLTMSSQPRHIRLALQMGAHGYVLKGAPSEELLHAIDEVCAGRSYLGHDVRGLEASFGKRDPDSDPFDDLSTRELEVVRLVVNGSSSADIARELHLSPKTVDSYRSRLMAKVGATDLTALVKLAIRHGLTDTGA